MSALVHSKGGLQPSSSLDVSARGQNLLIFNHDDSQPYIDLSHAPNDGKPYNWWYKTRLFLWDSADKHPLERKFLFKLDFFLLSLSMLGYFIKNLNQSNINTAYVNGMKEYYEMNSNQLNYMNTLWTVGYIIGAIPLNLILHRISARYYLGGLEITWSILTLLMITSKNLNGIYAIRFFLGLTEAGFFPGMEYLIGLWYLPKELAKRSTLFAVAGNAAGMCSGPLQLAVLKRFKHLSLAPFKWMFVLDAIISFPIGFYTMLVDPNTPSTTNAWYFNETDKLVALERRRRQGSALNTRSKYTVKKIILFFNTWHIWVFPVLFLTFNNLAAATGQPTFTTWMKYDLKLTPSQYNVYPTALSGAGIGAALVVLWFLDALGGRYNYAFLLVMFVSLVWSCAMLAHWDIPRGLHWFSYFLAGVPLTWGQPQIFLWVNRLLHHDDMKRNFVVVVTNTLAYVTNAWVPILVWDTRDAPRYHIGFTYTACLLSLGIVFTILTKFLDDRDVRRANRTDHEDLKRDVVDYASTRPRENSSGLDVQSVVESVGSKQFAK